MVPYGVLGGLFQTGEAPIRNIVTDQFRIPDIITPGIASEVSMFFGVNRVIDNGDWPTGAIYRLAVLPEI